MALSAGVVYGLTDILKNVPKMPDSKIVDRVCIFWYTDVEPYPLVNEI